MIKRNETRGVGGRRKGARAIFRTEQRAVRLLIHSLETRCFRRVLQWVIARRAAILNSRVAPLVSDAHAEEKPAAIYEYAFTS